MSTKQFLSGDVKALGDESSPNGEFEVILSAPTLDRDGEIIDARAFEPLPDHITFDMDHGMSTATTVGSGVPSYDEAGRLIVKGSFSSIPLGQTVRTLVTEGHIRTTSVAFMGAQRVTDEKTGATHITRAELLNGAFVPIPSNREALVVTAKSAKASGDAETVQLLHDQAAELGAVCIHDSAPADDTKSPDTAPEEEAAAPAPADPPAAGARAKAAAAMAEAALLLTD